MNTYSWDTLPAHDTEDRTRQVFKSERMTVLRQTIKAGHNLSGPHKHPEEQITIVLAGTAKVSYGGEEKILGPGGIVVFPPDVMHETQNATDGELVLQEIFAPGRADLNQLAP